MTASFEAQWALAGKGMAVHAFGHAMSASAMVASARSEIAETRLRRYGTGGAARGCGAGGAGAHR